MAVLSDCGAHCALASCRRLDFLPFRCESCGDTFCLDHFRVAAHACPKASGVENRVLVCPFCRRSLPLLAHEDPSITWQRHVDSTCPCPNGTKEPTQHARPKCPAKDCKQVLTISNSLICEQCGVRVCLKHRYEDCHDCVPAKHSRVPARITRKRTGGTKVEQVRRMVSATSVSSSGPRASARIGSTAACQPAAKSAARQSLRATGMGQAVAAVANCQSRSQQNSRRRATEEKAFSAPVAQLRRGATAKSNIGSQRPSPAGSSIAPPIPPVVSNATKRGLAQQSSILEVSSKTARPAQRNQQEQASGSLTRHAGSSIVSKSKPSAGSSKPRGGSDRVPMVVSSAAPSASPAAPVMPQASLFAVAQQWQCTRCTLQNPGNTTVCKACGGPCDSGRDSRWMGKLCAARGVIDLS